jgi:preprotein translocase subunit SecY
MLKLKKLTHLCAIILVHLILTIIPIIIFKIRSDNTPLNQNDLDNLNRICGSDISSLNIQSSMFALCIFHSVGFGLMYGFFALKYTNQSKLYFSGQWTYQNKLSALLHCVAQILCAGIVPVVVILGFGSFWKEGYSRFFVFNASLIVGTFMYIWLT